ncbi:adenylate/guanylate cyclase domain-containing protein [Beggiatoa leptomitoformis]|uniref:HAMP domain-containing protein n=1 Tax=Beggiatoa leptomitoformis TaxID=288004 RepID=A0A2N9YAS4_9GAMM|nr:adenylate/guanylate cyclase domain-containing protein [Beggiatoa leptomitoformis]AUI67566.1 HAMP domain-containing protein [Beggiatoa leptomitoformis]QGX03534.1 HAMP domain-containing protein [Beggiatoa leptomitoformis]
MLRFRRFRNRLLTFFVGLLVLVQAASFIAVNDASIENARSVMNQSLSVAAKVFNRLIEERVKILLEAARLLSGDFAFKAAYHTHTHGTILSATQNHLARLEGANVMMLVSLEGKIIADTMHPDITDAPVKWGYLLHAAENDPYGEASSIVAIDSRPYQMMVVPLLTPELEAWILIGFVIDDNFATDLSRLLLADVSILQQDSKQEWQTVASTLPETVRSVLPNTLTQQVWEQNHSIVLNMAGADYFSLATPLINKQNIYVIAVLQESLEEALKPYKTLRNALIILFIIGLFISITGVVLIAQSVTKPVLTLAQFARGIEKGDYKQHISLRQKDEIGELARTFNNMARGLEEKEKVRNLLGKVVSTAIAEELLNSKEIELGGEERVVTILFSDIRGFTALCENRAPRDILALLNKCLTKITEAIESNHGVVDKYIGDAVMALFGAPVKRTDSANCAVRTALAMSSVVKELNQEFVAQKLPKIEIGIGLHTGLVVVGNMGSETRLNYTAIGDGVNLASRLESLTKQYGVATIVSEATRNLVPEFVYRELDRVRVKGKTESVSIYELIGTTDSITPAQREELTLFHNALSVFRTQEWDKSVGLFLELTQINPQSKLYAIYLQRIEEYRQLPINPTWDGVHTFHEK